MRLTLLAFLAIAAFAPPKAFSGDYPIYIGGSRCGTIFQAAGQRLGILTNLEDQYVGVKRSKRTAEWFFDFASHRVDRYVAEKTAGKPNVLMSRQAWMPNPETSPTILMKPNGDLHWYNSHKQRIIFGQPFAAILQVGVHQLTQTLNFIQPIVPRYISTGSIEMKEAMARSFLLELKSRGLRNTDIGLPPLITVSNSSGGDGDLLQPETFEKDFQSSIEKVKQAYARMWNIPEHFVSVTVQKGTPTRLLLDGDKKIDAIIPGPGKRYIAHNNNEQLVVEIDESYWDSL